MQVYRGAAFRSEFAWTGRSLGILRHAEAKLRWTDKPFRWHSNGGAELFVVLSGRVTMLHGHPSDPSAVSLEAGDFLHILPGESHVADPEGEAVILVIEEVE